MKNIKVRNSTIGLIATHESFKEPAMCKVWYYDTECGRVLMRVENDSGEQIESLGNKLLELGEYENRPLDAYNDGVEARWAFDQFDLSID